jgi:hypothetical protein
MSTFTPHIGPPHAHAHASITTPNLANMPPVAHLKTTWNGYVGTTHDALMVFEGALCGAVNRVVRRPHDRERQELITSGSVFVYEECASGIKRWTDGIPWSPSRILGNYLIYRELEKPFPPGMKKRAAKKDKRNSEPYSRKDSRVSVPDDSPSHRYGELPSATTSPLSAEPNSLRTAAQQEMDKNLVGSLTDSYAFKEGGLIKKTMSVKVNDITYHLVSYYAPADVTDAKLIRPDQDPALKGLTLREELKHQQNFRTPYGSDEPADEGFRGSYSQQQQYAPQMNGTWLGTTAQTSYMQPHTQPYHSINPYTQGHMQSPLSAGSHQSSATPTTASSYGDLPTSAMSQQSGYTQYAVSNSPIGLLSPHAGSQTGYYNNQQASYGMQFPGDRLGHQQQAQLPQLPQMQDPRQQQYSAPYQNQQQQMLPPPTASSSSYSHYPQQSQQNTGWPQQQQMEQR